MKKLLLFIVSVLVVTTILPLENVAAAYSVKVGPVFNNPEGSVAQQKTILNQLIGAANNAPKGATIRVAVYSMTLDEFADALINAHNRGVNVRVLMSAHSINTLWHRVQGVLGSDSKARSFALTCAAACMNPKNGASLHAKFFMYSTAGTSKRVVITSSANPTNPQVYNAWNNSYAIVGDNTVYNSYMKYFEDMTAGALGKVQTNYYRRTTNGNHIIYMFPRAGNDVSTDTVESIFNNVACTKAAKGYGTAKGNTIIKVAMGQWTKGRVNLAKKLWNLQNAGCSVEVIYTASTTDPEILTALKKSGGKNGKITLLDSSKDLNGDGKADKYIHHKYFLIDGKYNGNASSKLVFTGSANWTVNALRNNEEVMIRIKDNAVHKQYLNNFNAIRTSISL